MKIIPAALFSLAILASATTLPAQTPGKAPRPDDHERFRAEVRNYKHEFLARELDMSKEQQREFFPVYDEMDDAIDKIATETRDLETRTASKADATEVELEAAARAVYSQKKEEGEIELQYFDRFKQILQPKQLLQLRAAERKFTRKLMRHHRQARDARKVKRD